MNDSETIAHFSRLAPQAESWQRADWGSPEGQGRRWGVIAEELTRRRVTPGPSVLDVGCGDGRLARLVPEWDYTGWDLLTGQNLFDPTAARFDWVVASGLWTYRPLGWAQDALARMWALCRRGVIVNSLSTIGPERPAGELVLAPADYLAWGFALSPHVSLRHDYWPGDMTLVVRR